MSDRIYLSPPHMGGEEIRFVQEAFDSNWISPAGPQLDLFEKELAQYLDVPGTAALSSGTAAVHLALVMLGVKPGDEVICQSFTFAGSVNPVVYQGATPVFIDSEPGTWNMDPEILDHAIRDRIKQGKMPKAIIVVDLYGTPARLDEIQSIAHRYNVPLIEDAAEALGSTFDGKAAGTFGEFGICSFNGNKIITTSGGGALIAANPAHLIKAKFLSTQARDPAPYYQHSEVGYNYRLSNVSAAIGRGQLRVLSHRVSQRRRIFDYYREHLDGEAIVFQKEPINALCNRWLTTILTSSYVASERIRLNLEKENIESRPLWKPMHLQPIFKDAPYYGGDVCKRLFERGICLPSGSAMTDEDLSRTLSVIRKSL
jgi:dTDP-4-amino-4,6-dideoxygalactose transaminase